MANGGRHSVPPTLIPNAATRAKGQGSGSRPVYP